MKIDGHAIRDAVLEALKRREKPGTSIVALLPRGKPESFGFVKQKKTVAETLGIPFRIEYLEAEDTTRTVAGKLDALGRDASCGGVIVQLPLPERFDVAEVLKHIPEDKDIDALGHSPRAIPPAAAVVERILALNARMIPTLHLAVVGRGLLVGKPVAERLKNRVRTFTLLDKGDDWGTLKNADVVVLGTGVPRLVHPDILKRGAGVIDFGYGRDESGNVSGDLDTRDEKALRRLSFWTPTPGGTGPVLVAELFNNFYILNGKY